MGQSRNKTHSTKYAYGKQQLTHWKVLWDIGALASCNNHKEAKCLFSSLNKKKLCVFDDRFRIFVLRGQK